MTRSDHKFAIRLLNWKLQQTYFDKIELYADKPVCKMGSNATTDLLFPKAKLHKIIIFSCGAN